ncbi:50S ribosomal protein L11 [Candidatus Nomurabacteria bacterium]|nr:50S ribosomal protein L11 [Candidatus Nomurabacteria bacterium]USN94609.1 MAG: 50S ribosomal protein L11 [Candidatus Nomurabacteria bacterium]
MAKKVIKKVKLQVPAGGASAAPPLGPALGQAGVNIGDFVQKFNESSKEMGGFVVSVVLSVYEDRSYDFIIKTPLTIELLKKEAGIQKGAGRPNSSRAGVITKDQLKKVAEIKMKDLNTDDIEAAMKIVAGTARQAGIHVE